MKRFLVLLVLLLGVNLAHAQDMGTVVQSCGNIALQYPVGQTRPIQVDTNGNLCIAGTGSAGSGSGGFPPNSIPVTSSATGTTGAVVATLPGTAGRFTYLCGFTATGNEAATGAIVAVTAAGTVSGSLNFNISHPVTPALGTLVEAFNPCVPSSGQNTAITVTSAADAAGTNVAVSAWGFQQ